MFKAIANITVGSILVHFVFLIGAWSIGATIWHAVARLFS